ncbi:hypothetical protein M422DRAFT_272547 [Sphaerobolus stellatus SS14]|uniref:DUF6534 domain-containing protein n=1 Tax=Sphaerobolus stellatus (strain SS14) TaxID=990650 RepID=A0A0C9TX72_SPHS4|nr:hypothetical protein M422DRAFT_272547 [Sphaerobolus stellatus SS14]
MTVYKKGVLLVQYYDYIVNFRYEQRWTKWLVHAGILLCSIRAFFIWWFIWDRFVLNYGNWAYVASFPAITIGIPITGTIPNGVFQAFYIARCWTLSHNWFVLIPAITSLVVTVGAGIAQTVAVSLVNTGKINSLLLIFTSSNVTLASGFTCDLFITSFTCYYLMRRKTGFSQTDGLVLRLVKCSIESAAGPTGVTLINLILNNTSGISSWFLFPSIVLTQVYGCSLLYTVNARRTVAEKTRGLSVMVSDCGGGGGGGGNVARQGTKTGTGGATMASGNRLWWTKSRNTEEHFGSTPTMPGIFVEVQTIQHEDDMIIDNPTVSQNTRQEESKAPTETSSAEAMTAGFH